MDSWSQINICSSLIREGSFTDSYRAFRRTVSKTLLSYRPLRLQISKNPSASLPNSKLTAQLTAFLPDSFPIFVPWSMSLVFVCVKCDFVVLTLLLVLLLFTFCFLSLCVASLRRMKTLFASPFLCLFPDHLRAELFHGNNASPWQPQTTLLSSHPSAHATVMSVSVWFFLVCVRATSAHALSHDLREVIFRSCQTVYAH